MAYFPGSSGDDIFTGGTDNDEAYGGAGADRLTGSDGNDTLTGGAGGDTLDGGAGDDRIYSGDPSPAYNLPYYGNGYSLPAADTGSTVDTLRGGDGSDKLFAGYGDNVDGGADGTWGDSLIISFMGAPSGLTIDFGQTTLTIGGGVITGFENISYVQGSQFGDNFDLRNAPDNGYSERTTISGMDGADTITAGYRTWALLGDGGDDFLDGRQSQSLALVEGGAGADTLYTNPSGNGWAYGGAGDDTIYSHGYTSGGAGNDLIVLQRTNYGAQVYGDEGDDRIYAAQGTRISGGAGADTLTGSADGDLLFSADLDAAGSPVDDTGLERDQLLGGDGDDVLAMGYGDNVDGGAGTDVLRLSLAGLGAGVDFDTTGIATGGSFSLGGGTVQNVETLQYLRGTEFADKLKLAVQSSMITVNAGAGDDTVASGGSTASVLGGAGDDRLISGPAGDYFDGGAGYDVVDYGALGAGVTVDLKAGTGAGGDSLYSVEGAVGTNFDDTLRGAGNGSTLWAGGGADRVELGARDIASLGTGADFVSVTPGSGSGSGQGAFATVYGWGADDKLQFGSTTGAYVEVSAGSYAEAVQAAEQKAAAGYNFVSVQVGSDVFVFGQPNSERLHFNEAVKLIGTDLNAVSETNVGLPGPMEAPVTPPASNPPPSNPPSSSNPPSGSASNPSTPPSQSTAPPASPPPAERPSVVAEPAPPGQPTMAGGGASGAMSVNMDLIRLGDFYGADITRSTSTQLTLNNGNQSVTLSGVGFTYDGNDQLVGGTVTGLSFSSNSPPMNVNLNNLNVSAAPFGSWVVNNATGTALATLLAGNDALAGSQGADLIRGFSGGDLIEGGGGADQIYGGLGDDQIFAVSKANPGGAQDQTYLRGDDGADNIVGGAGFDDINGNVGNDTGSGGLGNDWVVGGKDNDLLFGEAGDDIVYGNLGVDTCVGGAGNDIVRGGQQEDALYGGDGDDWLSGDRGTDTVTGGAGADTFHAFGDAGVDWVMDFNRAEGDRVRLDAGTAYTVSQQGGDVVIDMGGANQVVLAGVQMSSLAGDWITVG